MTFHLVSEPGDPPVIGGGPYDARLGYASLSTVVDGLRKAGFRVIAHTQFSSLASGSMKVGLPPIYREKTQAGLLLEDDQGVPLFQAETPQHIYQDYSSIPDLIVQSLLLAENREMLDASTPNRNPTIEWSRLARALVDFGFNQIYHGHPVTGGSTIATQLEKLRHSPGGRTTSAPEKFRQMLAASLRAYPSGPKNLVARRQIVCDYINSLPLAAMTGYGEVIGLADGLKAWFGVSTDRVNLLLNLSDQEAESTGQLTQKALAYRQALTLLLAAKKPSTYLVKDAATLTHRVDSYLPLLAQEGVISRSLFEATLKTRLAFRNEGMKVSTPTSALRKSSDTIRIGLIPILGVKSLYDLDRFDLTVRTALDRQATAAVTDKLRSFAEPGARAKAGIYGPHLLHPDTAHGVVFSFTLYERGVGGNFLRIQTDSYNQPLNINQGTKLELGSTAKLRALACYLDLISELHARLSNKTVEELRTVHADSEDALLIWAIRYLSTTSNKSLSAMLNAAIDRTYSANPVETFFTGGGNHTFSNFETQDNGRILTVREAFERSVNLVFIRLQRDIVRCRIFEHGEAREVLDSNTNSPLRLQYLRRFADMEGTQYLETFYTKYKAAPNSAWLTLLEHRTLTPTRFAAMYRYLRPDATLSQFKQFAVSHTVLIRPDDMENLYTKYGPGKFTLNDLAYLTHVHPLDLWLADYLSHHPSASLQDAVIASESIRQESYSWLFKTNRKQAQDLRIGIILERDAFDEIHREWARLGFPFNQLVPSLATAIGSSGDNPDALAILAGIILNNGVRYPSIRIRQLHFGEGTPMETVLEPKEATAERVIPEEVAKILQRELIGVVEHGTGQRARESIVLDDGTVIQVGGKTGTGDNRIEEFGPHGAVRDAKIRNRTAAFVFTIGDRFFGTVLAYSVGKDAAAQSFTSSLAVQVFRDLIPSLRTLLTNDLSGEHH